MNIEVMKLVRDNIKMGSVLSFAEVMIIQQALDAAMLQGAVGNSPVIPDGWVLVPVEPTHEMLEAGDEQFGTYDVYRRMITAAPQQEVE